MTAICATAFTVMLTGLSWSQHALDEKVPCYEDGWTCKFAAANMTLAFAMDGTSPKHSAECKPTEK